MLLLLLRCRHHTAVATRRLLVSSLRGAFPPPRVRQVPHQPADPVQDQDVGRAARLGSEGGAHGQAAEDAEGEGVVRGRLHGDEVLGARGGRRRAASRSQLQGKSEWWAAGAPGAGKGGARRAPSPGERRARPAAARTRPRSARGPPGGHRGRTRGAAPRGATRRGPLLGTPRAR